MRRHLLIIHGLGLLMLPKHKLYPIIHCQIPSLVDMPWPTSMLPINIASPQALLRCSPVFLPLCNFIQLRLIVPMHHIIIFNICNITQTIIRHLNRSLFHSGLWSLRWIYLILLSPDKSHKFINSFQWIIVNFIILLAARAVDVLMLLADQVLHDSLYFWGKVTLRTVPIEGFDVLGKLFHVNLLFKGGHFAQIFIFLVSLFHFDQFGLMNSELIF
jgi:hypothetical protein